MDSFPADFTIPEEEQLLLSPTAENPSSVASVTQFAPSAFDTAPLSGPVRVKLRVSADTRRQMAGSVMRFPLENGSEALLALSETASVAENVAPAKLEQCGLSAAAALQLSRVLVDGLGDWIWNANVTVCKYSVMADAAVTDPAPRLHSLASLGVDARVVLYSIRLGNVEVVNMSVSVPTEPFKNSECMLFPSVGVFLNGAGDSVLPVVAVLTDNKVSVQMEMGEMLIVDRSMLTPALTRKTRDRVAILGGKYAGRFGKIVASTELFVQLQMEDDDLSVVAVPAVWVARRRDVRSEEETRQMLQFKAQRDELVSAMSVEVTPGKNNSNDNNGDNSNNNNNNNDSVSLSAKGRVRVKKIDPDMVETPSVHKRIRDKPAKAKKTAGDSEKKEEKSEKKKPKSVIDASSASSAVAVAASSSSRDDFPVPLRGTPPDWLFHSWQGAMLVKVPTFPPWPCRIGSTVDLSEFPAASNVPESQKQAFVYFFGDKTVAWVRFDDIKPWPVQNEASELAKISVPKKHVKLWNVACDEASAWNANVAPLPPAPAPVDPNAPTLPEEKKAAAPSGSKKRGRPAKRSRNVDDDDGDHNGDEGGVSPLLSVHDSRSGVRPTRTAGSRVARERHMKKSLFVVDAPAKGAVVEDASWIDSVVCLKCKLTENENVMLLCDNAVCTAAMHTYCCDPPLSAVPETSWFCPMHSMLESVFCGVCQGGENEDLMLLCDSPDCKAGYHMYCLNPPLEQIPSGEWLCPNHDGSGGASAASEPGKPPASHAMNKRLFKTPQQPPAPASKVGPVKPKTAFSFYADEFRESAKAELGPGVGNQDVHNFLQGRWKELNDESRSRFQESAARDKERFEQEVNEYVAKSLSAKKSDAQPEKIDFSSMATPPAEDSNDPFDVRH